MATGSRKEQQPAPVATNGHGGSIQRRHCQYNNHTSIQLVNVVPDEIPLFEPNRKVILIFNNPLPKNVTMNVCIMGLTSRKVSSYTPRTLNEYTLEVRGLEHTTPEDTKLSVRVGEGNKELCVYRRPFVFLSRLSLVGKLIEDESDPVDFLCTAFRLEKKTIAQLDGELTRRFCVNMPSDYRLLRDVDWNGNHPIDHQQTLLHFAAQYNFIQLLNTLLECPGAIRLLQSENHFGSTPIELAKEYGHLNLVKHLEKVSTEGRFVMPSQSEYSKAVNCADIKEKYYTDPNPYMCMDGKGANNTDGYVQMRNAVKQLNNSLPPEKAEKLGKTSAKFGVIDDRFSRYDVPPPKRNPPRKSSNTCDAVIDDKDSTYDIPPEHRRRQTPGRTSNVSDDSASSPFEQDEQSFYDFLPNQDEAVYDSLPNQDGELYDSLPNQNGECQDVFSKSAPSRSNSGSRDNMTRKDRLKDISIKQTRPPPLQPRRHSAFLDASSDADDMDRASPRPQPRSQISQCLSLNLSHDEGVDCVSHMNQNSDGRNARVGEDRLSEMRSRAEPSEGNRSDSISSHSSNSSTTSDERQGIHPPPRPPAVDYPKKRTLSRSKASPIDDVQYHADGSDQSQSEEPTYNTTRRRSSPAIHDVYQNPSEAKMSFPEVLPEHPYEKCDETPPAPVRRRSGNNMADRAPAQPPPIQRKPMPPVPTRRKSSPPLLK